MPVKKLKKVAVTIGEPGGIGPEVALKAVSDPEVRSACVPILIGGRPPLEKMLKKLKLPVKIRSIAQPEESRPEAGFIELIETGGIGAKNSYKPGLPTAAGGKASYEYIKKAAEFAMGGRVAAICTAPISKEALKMAGVDYPGHTEMLASLTGTSEFAMMLMGGPLRVLLVTTHVAIKNVPRLIKKEAVLGKIMLAARAATMLGIRKPRIAVCGLNPHAGESGLFGNEDMNEIAPAVREAANRGIKVLGPFAPDALFRKAYTGQVDIVVAMYHDQGLIPLKMVAFEKGVNVTIGLPIIRTSPDHGTAYDIAWKGKADPASMIEAIRTALKLRL